MSLAMITTMTAHFIAIALFVQGIEIFILARKKSTLLIWSYENLKFDLEPGLPLPNKMIEWLFADSMVRAISLLQVVISIAAFLYPHAVFFIFLVFTHLWICIRFRGTFNGGSDMMTFVLLTGMLIVYLAPDEKNQNLGFIYISISTIYSYFKAGLVKVINKEWRTGKALPDFLSRSLYIDTKKVAAWLRTKSFLSFIFCWFVIIFEIGILSLLFFPQFIFPYFLAACVFHTLIFVSYGLNRFFWVWLAAWPSLFYAVSLIPRH